MATVTLAPPILRLDVTFKQGAGATVVLTVVDALGGAITGLTGYGVRAQIRGTTNGIVLFEWNTTPGPGVTTATLAYSATTLTTTLTLPVTAAQTALFTFEVARWDGFLTAPNQEPACLFEGVVTVDPYITR